MNAFMHTSKQQTTVHACIVHGMLKYAPMLVIMMNYTHSALSASSNAHVYLLCVRAHTNIV